MNKVVHLTSMHKPFDTRIFYKECLTLKNAGYDVVLIAPHDSEEIKNDVLIRNVRIENGRLKRMTNTIYQVYKLAIKEKGAIYHFHDPELIPVGLMLKLRGKKVVYDVHEHYPRMILSKDWIHKVFRIPISLLTNMFEVISSLFFDKIVVVLPFIGRRFQRKKVVVVHNYLLRDDLKLNSNIKYRNKPMNVIYHGSITKERGAVEMIYAIDEVNKTVDTKLMLAGSFDTDELFLKAKSMPGWKYVDYKGWIDKKEVMDLLSRSRIGIAILHPVSNHLNCLPSKLFEYMAMKIPIIISDFQMWKSIIDKYKCGIALNPLDKKGIADALVWLLQNPEIAEEMGENGRRAVETEFTWDSEGEKLLSAYDSLCKLKN